MRWINLLLVLRRGVMKQKSLLYFITLAVLLCKLVFCAGCRKTTTTHRPIPTGQRHLVELEAFSRPVKAGEFARLPRDDDPVQPLRWVHFGTSLKRFVAISPDRKQAVVSSMTQTIVYDLVDRKHLHEWNELFQEAMFSPDGKFLVTRKQNKISVWDSKTFQARCKIVGGLSRWRDTRGLWGVSVAIDQKGEQIAVNNHRQHFDDNSPEGLLIYSTRDGQLKYSIKHPYECASQFLLDGKRLLCSRLGSEGNLHVLFDISTGKELAAFNQIGLKVVVSPDGQSFATARCEGPNFLNNPRWNGPTTLNLYDAESARVKRTLEYPLWARNFTFSPDNRRLLVAFDARGEAEKLMGDRGHLVEWDVATGQELFKATDELKSFATVAYSPSGNRRFATTEAPNGVDDDVSRWLHGWEVDSGKNLSIGTKEISFSGQESLILFPRGEVYIDANNPFAINMLNGETVLTLPESQNGAKDAEFMPGDDKFAVPGVLADISSGEMRHWGTGKNATFVNGGRLLFSHSYRSADIIDVLSGTGRWSFHFDVLEGFADTAISRDGKWIAIASDTHPYRKSPLSTIMLIEVTRPFDPIIVRLAASAVDFHPDGERLLAASADAICEYEVPSGKLLRKVWNTPGRTLDMSYSNEGNSVAICGVKAHQDFAESYDISDGGWAAIVETSSGKAQHLEGHAAPVNCLAFSIDDNLIATGSMDATVRLWNSAGKPLKSFNAHHSPIDDITFNTEKSMLLSTAMDGAAIWDLSSIVAATSPAPSVASSFRVVEKLHIPTSEANKSEKELFDGDSTLRQLGPTREIRVVKQNWSFVQIGSKNSDVLKQLRLGHPSWLDLSISERAIPSLKTTSAGQWPQGLRLLDISCDKSMAVLENRKDRKIVILGANNELIQTYPFIDSRENYIGIEARLSRSLKTLIVQTSLGGKKQLDAYDVATAQHKYAIKDIHMEHANCFAIDPQERTLLVRNANVVRELYDLQTGQPIARKELIRYYDSDFSVAGNYIIATPWNPYNSAQLEVELFDPLTLEKARTLKCDFPVLFAQVTPDGKRTIAGHAYGNGTKLMSCWDVESGKQLWSRVGTAGHNGIFSPTGKYYLCGDKALWTLWEVESGEVECVIAMDADKTCLPQDHAAFSTQDDALYFGSVDGPQLWTKNN